MYYLTLRESIPVAVTPPSTTLGDAHARARRRTRLRLPTVAPPGARPRRARRRHPRQSRSWAGRETGAAQSQRGSECAECCGSTGARADGSQHAATRPGARLSTIERQYSFFENSTVRVHKHGPRTPRELTMRGTRVTRVCSDGAIPGRFWPILDFSCRRHTPRVS